MLSYLLSGAYSNIGLMISFWFSFIFLWYANHVFKIANYPTWYVLSQSNSSIDIVEVCYLAFSSANFIYFQWLREKYTIQDSNISTRDRFSFKNIEPQNVVSDSSLKYLLFSGAFELIRDESKAGSCLWITNRRGMEYWPTPAEEAKYRLPSSKALRKSLVTVPMDFQIPQSFEKVYVIV